MSGGYYECPCCSEILVGTDEEIEERALCDACQCAGCEPSEDADGVFYQACEIPQCEHCDTRASLCTDGRWHSNCDDDCPNAKANWPA